MSTNAEENKADKKVGIFELLRELGNRLRDEISLLAFVFALIVALVAISAPHFSIWVGVTFVAIYLIAVVFYVAVKLRKASLQMRRETKEYIKWRMMYPSAFQNPYKILKERPNLRVVHFDITLELMNQSKKPITANVYFKSPTQCVVFVWDEPKKVWRRRFGIIPYREEVEIALDVLDNRYIDVGQTEIFRLHGWYRPHFAYKDFDLRGTVTITYRIYAKSNESLLQKAYFDTGEKKIIIPFKDVVEYAKGE